MTLSPILRVVLWMTGALLSFSIMALSVRGLSAVLTIPEILAVRAGFGLALALGALLVYPALRHEINRARLGLHGLRNTLHLAGQFLWAHSLLLLPLATVFSLEFTMPAWTVGLAAILLRERLTVSRIGVVVLGLVGVVVIVRPGLDTFNPNAMFVLLAALFYASTMIFTKMLTRDQSTFAIIFWMNVIQFPLTLLASDPWFVTKLTAQQWLPILGIGIAGSSAHFFLSKAFRAGDASLVVPFDFLRIPLIALIGYWFYAERLDAMVLLGATIIVAGVMWNIRREARGL